MIGNLERINVNYNLNIYYIKTNKFNTNSINIIFEDYLNSENNTKNSLLCAVLRRGCSKFPNIIDINFHLDKLYGATLICRIIKKGHKQILQFSIEFVSNKYIKENDISKASLEFLLELITRPLLDNNRFKSEYFIQEKEDLRNLLNSNSNDVLQYAYHKCLFKQNEGDSISLSEFGDPDFIDSISLDDLYEQWLKLFKCKKSILFFGDINLKDALDTINSFHILLSHSNRQNDCINLNKRVFNNEIKEINEVFRISESILNIGLSMENYSIKEDYVKLLLYNEILGNGRSSRLFKKIRNAGLAYFSQSIINKFTGSIIITCGISSENKQEIYKKIEEQLEDMRSGNILDTEFETSKNIIEENLFNLQDNRFDLLDFYIDQIVLNNFFCINEFIDNLKEISKKEMIDVSKRIKINTILYLSNK